MKCYMNKKLGIVLKSMAVAVSVMLLLSVSVFAGTVTATGDKETAAVGDTYTVNIVIDGAEGAAVAPDVSVHYDVNRLEFVSCTGEYGGGGGGLLRQFVKAGVDDIATEVHHQFYDVLHLSAANLIGHGVGLEEYLHNAGSLFLVLIYNINRLLGVGHGVVLVSGGVFRHLDGREDVLDALLYLIDIDVAHHDNALQVGAIPLLVIVAQFLRLEVVDNAHKADGEALAVARAGIEFRQAALERLRAQKPDSFYRAHADYVLCNVGSLGCFTRRALRLLGQLLN